MSQPVSYVSVTELLQALDMSEQMVNESIAHVSSFLPKMRPYDGSPFNRYTPYVYSHLAFIASKDDGWLIADYYAYLQSFAQDFAFSLPELASTAMLAFKESDKVELILRNSKCLEPVQKADSLFIDHSELNPYLFFMRGHLSAYTVVNLAVVNIQLALACELLNSSTSFGKTALPSTYLVGLKAVLGLVS